MTSWDEQAATFDDEPDHGLRDPAVRAAWADLLLPLMPPAPARIADLGCGTGSLAVLLAGAGYEVWGVDLSPRMIEHAVRKAAGLPATFRTGDAARPGIRPGTCDVVLARHVLWALPSPAAALATWVQLLRPGGVLVLVEGRWSTGAGILAAECAALVRMVCADVRMQPLTDPALWGGPIDDERYLLVGREPT